MHNNQISNVAAILQVLLPDLYIRAYKHTHR